MTKTDFTLEPNESGERNVANSLLFNFPNHLTINFTTYIRDLRKYRFESTNKR